MYLQFGNASGKHVRLYYQIFSIVLAINITLIGLFFFSPIVKSEEKINSFENETIYTSPDSIIDKNYIIQNNYDLIVDKNGGQNYMTIKEAVDKAKEGSTIFIKTGVYNEILDIKKTLTLIGENKETTIINPISDENKYAINAAAPNVVISDLSINNKGPGLYTSGIRITASNVKILNCDIYDNPLGIAIWTSDNIINNCRFWGCVDEGIALLGTSYSECCRNTIKNCIFENNCDGIEMQYSSNNIIINCEFYKNTHTGINAIEESNDKNKITDCIINNNNVNGIYLSSSSNNQIIDCIISNNKDGNVITVGSSYNNKIENITNSTAFLISFTEFIYVLKYVSLHQILFL